MGVLKVILAAIIVAAVPNFASAQSIASSHPVSGGGSGGDIVQPYPISPGHDGDQPLPSPTPISDGTPPVITQAAQQVWKNTGTDFNDGASWVSGIAPSAGDVAAFSGAEATNPQLTASTAIAGLYFKGAGASGYDLTSPSSQTLTLTASGTSIGAETGDTNAVAIGAENTLGTNTIDVPILLAPSTGNTSTFSQASGGTLVINGVISGSGKELNITGAGTVVLNATNTYNGGTVIKGGSTLVLGNATDTLSDTGLVDVQSGTLSLGSNNDTVGGVTLEAGSSITGTGALTVNGPGNFQILSGTVSANLAGSANLVKFTSGGASLTGTNTYTGGTLINGGDLTFNNSSALGTGPINFGPNGLDSMSLMSTTTVVLSNDITINDLSATPGRTATLGSFAINAAGTNAYTGNIALNNDLRVESSSATSNPLTFSTGVISGTKGLIINPSGTLSPGAVKLAGNNTYQGGTIITQGSLLITGGVVGSLTNSGTGTGAVTVSGSGTILAGGSTTGTTGSILGAVSIGSGARLAPGTSGNGSGTTAILHTGALTLSSGSFFNVDLNSTTAGTGYDQVVSSGAISLSGSTLSVTVGGTLQLNDKFFILDNSSLTPNTAGVFTNGATVSSGGYTFAINYLDTGDATAGNDISLTVIALPEPGTWVGAALALGAVGYSQRKRILRLLKRDAF
ncbi:MAG: mucin9 [Verrucomicrobiota bacterium]|jgi:autotransporter-associated beta strand protein